MIKACAPRDEREAINELTDSLRDPAPIAYLYGEVNPLPEQFLPRSGVFSAAADALKGDAIKVTVISAPGKHESHAVSVYGMGGVGKSTLAAALAHDCQIRRHFHDGIIWLEVGQTPVIPALQAAIGKVFGDNPEHYQDERTGSVQLSAILKDRTILIVLDDVWDHRVTGHFPVNGTSSRLLITTRSSQLADLVEGADIKLETLTPEEGARLIALWTGGSPEDVDSLAIAELLGGHTLAIVLAAAQIANRYAESPAVMLRLLRKRAEGTEPFSDLMIHEDDKSRNLALSLSLSYDALSADLQRRFRATGVFALNGTFDRAALAAVWGDADEDDARAPLKALEGAGLLEPAGTTGRYQQHRLLRAYASALLDRDGESAAVFGRYADYVIEQALQFYQLPLEEWGQLDPLLPHVDCVGDELAAQYASMDTADEALLKQAEDFAYAVTRYVHRRPLLVVTERGRELRGLRWLEMGLAISRFRGNQRRSAFYFSEIGLAWSALGEKRKALDFYHQALPLFSEVGDKPGEAAILTNIGTVLSDLGDKRKALDFLQQALPLFSEVGDKSGEATTLNNIGGAWSALGEKRKALDFYHQALPLRREVGDKSGEATTLNNIGGAWSALGEKRKALDFYHQALPLFSEMGDKSREATTLNNIGGAWDALGEKRKALGFYHQALPLSREVGDKSGEATTLNNIGGAWSALGEKRKALDFYHQALPLFSEVGDKSREAVTCFNIGMIYAGERDLDKAIEYLERCVQLDIEVEHPDLESDRRTLEKIKAMRDGLDSSAAEAQAADTMRQLVRLYNDKGADAVRDLLKGRAPDEVVEQLIAQLAAAAETSGSSPSTLPDEAIQQLAGNTYAVMTSHSDRQGEWRKHLQRVREDFEVKGDDYQIEVAFADALLSILDGGSPKLAEDNPYTDVVQQVVDAITEYRRANDVT